MAISTIWVTARAMMATNALIATPPLRVSASVTLPTILDRAATTKSRHKLHTNSRTPRRQPSRSSCKAPSVRRKYNSSATPDTDRASCPNRYGGVPSVAITNARCTTGISTPARATRTRSTGTMAGTNRNSGNAASTIATSYAAIGARGYSKTVSDSPTNSIEATGCFSIALRPSSSSSRVAARMASAARCR